MDQKDSILDAATKKSRQVSNCSAEISLTILTDDLLLYLFLQLVPMPWIFDLV